MLRGLASLVLGAAVLAPRGADAFVTVEGFYGINRPGAADFSSAVSGLSAPDLLATSAQIAGGDLLLGFGLLEFGGVVDTSWKTDSASSTTVGATGGVRLDFGELRLDALGEIGGHRYGNLLNNPAIVSAGSTDEWLVYVGLRPGVAWTFGMGGARLLLGVWAFARWDVTSNDVPVTVSTASGSQPGTYKLGGTSIGAALRLGIEL